MVHNSDAGSALMDIDGVDQVPSDAADAPNTHAHLCQSPVCVVCFGGQAGKPMYHPSAAGPGPSKGMGYKTYTQEVDPKSENPYAPFTSRLDWEIAHWTKLRSSGSTAFSDLLAIEEVCQPQLCYGVVYDSKLDLHLRFVSDLGSHTRIQMS